jgi:decaprenyl-phosphate phosphoribosyltransferase
MLNYIKLMRPHQYVKNSFIFLPAFFALQFNEMKTIIDMSIAFVAFSLLASAVYIFNDYLDIENDRKHPKKRLRPLAAGLVSKPAAIILMCVLIVIAFVIISYQPLYAMQLLGAYFLMNVAYSMRLKHIAIIDVFIIAIGFVLRLFVGSAVSDIKLSMWIVIMTFLLALFMALAKRRDDVLIFLETGTKARKVIDGYNLRLLDSAMMIMSSIVIVAYIMYTTSTEVIERVNSSYLYITSIFVILGILRYLQIAFVEKNSGSPTRIVLQDRFMQLTIFAWLLSFIWLLYL